jgi:hypothetical protein
MGRRIGQIRIQEQSNLALWVATLLLCSDGYLLLTFNDVQNRANVCFALKAAYQRRPLG